MRLQAAEHDLIAIVHDGAAEARYVARAGVVSLLREGAGSKHNKWNDKQYSDHLISLRPSMTLAF